MAKVSAELKELEPQLAEAEEELHRLLAETPNVPHESAPDGFTEEDAVEVKRNHDEPPAFDFEPRDHAELGAMLGVLDTERGARTSGSRFVYLMGDLVFVQFALMRHAMDVVVEKGFSPMIPPVLVREEAMYGTGFLPTDAVNIYVDPRGRALPRGHVRGAARRVPPRRDRSTRPTSRSATPGYSTCFRREAGSYGKDLGGMFRVHQFDKVEMFAFCTPETSWDEHERILAIEEEIIGNLEIPYRVVNIAAGDLGGAAAKKYDIEAWLPAPGPLPRAHVVLEHHGLPGAADADARAAGRRRRRGAPHAERHGDRDRPNADRDHGEPPARRRERRDPREASPVSTRARSGALAQVRRLAARGGGRLAATTARAASCWHRSSASRLGIAA